MGGGVPRRGVTSRVSFQVTQPDRAKGTSNLVLLWAQTRGNAAYSKRVVTQSDVSGETPSPPPSSPSAILCVNDPPAELALVNLVHAVLQYCGLENYSSGGEGTCTVAATGGVCANGLLLAALRSRIPGGNSKEGFKTIYRRDVCLQVLCRELRHKTELARTADAAPQDAVHWSKYGNLNDVLLALLLDKHAVDSKGSFCFLLGVGVIQLDLTKALQSATLTPAQVLVLCALRHIAPVIGNDHFADCSKPYRSHLLESSRLAVTPVAGLHMRRKKKHKKEDQKNEQPGGGYDSTPVTKRKAFDVVDHNKLHDVSAGSSLDLVLTHDNMPSRLNDNLLIVLQLSICDVLKRGLKIAYTIQFLKPDFLKNLTQLRAKQDYGGGLVIHVDGFADDSGGGAPGSSASSSGAVSSSSDERELADCVMALDEACTALEVSHNFLIDVPAQPSSLRASITRLQSGVSRTLLDLVRDLLSRALVACSQDGTSAAGDDSYSDQLTLIPRSLAAPLPTAPFEFTVRNIDLSEPLARVGGMQNGHSYRAGSFVEVTYSW